MITIIPGDETAYSEEEASILTRKCLCLIYPTTVNGTSFTVSCLLCGRKL
jgi:hypothetical protein